MREYNPDKVYLDNLYQNFLNQLLKQLNPNLFITIELHSGLYGCKNSMYEQLAQQSYDDFHKHCINIIDHYIYGSRHRKKDKFAYAFRVESSKRNGKAALPHIHAFLELSDQELHCFQTKEKKIKKSILGFSKLYDYSGNILVLSHDGNSTDYISKYPFYDAQNFFERKLRTRLDAVENIVKHRSKECKRGYSTHLVSKVVDLNYRKKGYD